MARFDYEAVIIGSGFGGSAPGLKTPPTPRPFVTHADSNRSRQKTLVTDAPTCRAREHDGVIR